MVKVDQQPNLHPELQSELQKETLFELEPEVKKGIQDEPLSEPSQNFQSPSTDEISTNRAEHDDQKNEVTDETTRLTEECENSKSDLNHRNIAVEYEILRIELKEAKGKCELFQQDQIKLQTELGKVVQERNFLVERLEQNRKNLDAQYNREIHKLKKRVEALEEIRSALLKKVGILQLNNKKNQRTSSTRDMGTQADFTVSIVTRVPEDNQSLNSKTSGLVSLGGKSERSEMSGISFDTMGTSDTRSIKMHASRVLSMARRVIGVKARKNAVSDVSTAEKSQSQSPPNEKKSSRPPIPRPPASSKRPPKPLSPKNKKSTSTPKDEEVEKHQSKKDSPESKSSSKMKMKDKLFKSKSTKKSGNKSQMSFKDTPDDIDFFLPKVSLDGSDQGNEKSSDKENDLDDDPTSLMSVLRPWQVEFLESVRITTSSQLVFASKYKSSSIAKSMVKWRAERNMKHMKSKACAVALHVWTRTIEAKIRSCLLERSSGSENMLVDKQIENKSTIGSGLKHAMVNPTEI